MGVYVCDSHLSFLSYFGWSSGALSALFVVFDLVSIPHPHLRRMEAKFSLPRISVVVWSVMMLSLISCVVGAFNHSRTISRSISLNVSTSDAPSSNTPSAAPTNSPVPPYNGPTQAQSSPSTISPTQTLINVRTDQALVLGGAMFSRDSQSIGISDRMFYSTSDGGHNTAIRRVAQSTVRSASITSRVSRATSVNATDGNHTTSMSVDEILARYYTWGAAYEMCRWLSFHLQMLVSASSSNAGVAGRFLDAVESSWDEPMSVVRSYRNATCNLSSGSIGISVAILTEVPQVNRSVYPPSFSAFVMGHGIWAEAVISLISVSFSTKYRAPYRPLDLAETIGFTGLVYSSPLAPKQSTVSVYAVTKESPFSAAGGVAIWTFLMIQVLSICGAVVFGMTLVRWLIKPPSLPPLKERIMRGFDQDGAPESARKEKDD